MENKLTAQIVALYLGSPYVFENETYEVAGINGDTVLDTSCDESGEGMHHIDDIKLILRPLSDMTEEEAIEWNDKFKYFVEGTAESYIKDRLHSIQERAANKQYSPEQFTWLLSKGFDLFGLLDNRLALPTPPNK